MSVEGPGPRDGAPGLAALLEGLDTGAAVLFAGSPVAQVVVDRAGRLIRANPALSRLVGVSGRLDDTLHVSALFMPAAWAGIQAALHAVLAGAGRAGIGRAVPLAPAGTVVVDLFACAIREADGGVGGVLLHLCDASGRVGLEAQLAQASALRDVGQRAGGVAHDVNNLLAVVAATVAEALARPGLDGASRDAFAEVGDAARRGAALVRQLLGGGSPRAAAVVAGVDPALRALEAPLRRVLGGIPLVRGPGMTDAAVAIDPEDLDRVLTNLALNARNAMPSGGTLTVGSGEREVTEAVSQFGDAVVPGRYVVVAVRDTGTGMSPDVMARLFEPFFTTRAGQGGTGLGLASVRQLVRQAGGFIEVDSEPGSGTTVRVHLPWCEAVPAGRPGMAGGGGAAGAAPSGRGMVLLVDDEAGLLRLGERALSRAGWHVVTASCVADALAALEDGGLVPRVIVTDLVLPDGDGLALVDVARRRCPGLPAVLTSGYADDALRDRAASAGVTFLAKPCGMAVLLDQVARSAQPPG